MNTYHEVVSYLESLQIMPKTMPGLQKIKKALEQTKWYQGLEANKIIVVAGTNGKGTTCAALESLLLEAGQKVGFYSSPHLVSTTERIRALSQNISEENFIKLFNQCFSLIQSCELSHFEALTLMAGHYFFSDDWNLNLDFAILEVGLGGSFDATNAFPHKYSVITKLGLDHTNILGNTLTEVAKNKFGVVTKKGIVVHQALAPELSALMQETKKTTNSNWIESDPAGFKVKKTPAGPKYFMTYMDSEFEINIPGLRACENIMTAVGAFHAMGFTLPGHEQALNKIKWQGRMQRVNGPGMKCPLYLSGDHNSQGVESLLEILKDHDWKVLHLVVGIGLDKDAEAMFQNLLKLQNLKLYLTETPFKGRKVNDYPAAVRSVAVCESANVNELLKKISETAGAQDLCVVTGSLYLVGEVLKIIST